MCRKSKIVPVALLHICKRALNRTVLYSVTCESQGCFCIFHVQRSQIKRLGYLTVHEKHTFGCTCKFEPNSTARVEHAAQKDLYASWKSSSFSEAIQHSCQVKTIPMQIRKAHATCVMQSSTYRDLCRGVLNLVACCRTKNPCSLRGSSGRCRVQDVLLRL